MISYQRLDVLLMAGRRGAARDLSPVLVGDSRQINKKRISYLDLGLAGGQSRFLVEDSLRDDRFAVLSRGWSSGEPCVLSKKDGSPLALDVHFCEDWPVVIRKPL